MHLAKASVTNLQFNSPKNKICNLCNYSRFLESKLGLLDPSKSSSIQIGTALQILKYTGLRSNDIQKIIRYLKLEGM